MLTLRLHLCHRAGRDLDMCGNVFCESQDGMCRLLTPRELTELSRVSHARRRGKIRLGKIALRASILTRLSVMQRTLMADCECLMKCRSTLEESKKRSDHPHPDQLLVDSRSARKLNRAICQSD